LQRQVFEACNKTMYYNVDSNQFQYRIQLGTHKFVLTRVPLTFDYITNWMIISNMNRVQNKSVEKL